MTNMQLHQPPWCHFMAKRLTLKMLDPNERGTKQQAHPSASLTSEPRHQCLKYDPLLKISPEGTQRNTNTYKMNRVTAFPLPLLLFWENLQQNFNYSVCWVHLEILISSDKPEKSAQTDECVVSMPDGRIWANGFRKICHANEETTNTRWMTSGACGVHDQRQKTQIISQISKREKIFCPNKSGWWWI